MIDGFVDGLNNIHIFNMLYENEIYLLIFANKFFLLTTVFLVLVEVLYTKKIILY